MLMVVGHAENGANIQWTAADLPSTYRSAQVYEARLYQQGEKIFRCFMTNFKAYLNKLSRL